MAFSHHLIAIALVDFLMLHHVEGVVEVVEVGFLGNSLGVQPQFYLLKVVRFHFVGKLEVIPPIGKFDQESEVVGRQNMEGLSLLHQLLLIPGHKLVLSEQFIVMIQMHYVIVLDVVEVDSQVLVEGQIHCLISLSGKSNQKLFGLLHYLLGHEDE